MFIYITYLLVLLNSCRKEDDRQNYIWFNNNSDYELNIYTSYNYPNTTISFKGGGYIIYPQTKKSLISKNGWKREIEIHSPKKTLIMFIFSADTLRKYSKQEIIENYKVLKRYDLSIEQLKKQNWTITYP